MEEKMKAFLGSSEEELERKFNDWNAAHNFTIIDRKFTLAIDKSNELRFAVAIFYKK